MTSQRLRSDNVGIIWDNPLTTFRGPVEFEDTISGAAINKLINSVKITQVGNNIVLSGTSVPVFLTAPNYTTDLTNWNLDQQITLDNTIVLGQTFFRFPEKGKAFITWNISYDPIGFPHQYRTTCEYHPIIGGPLDTFNFDHLRLLTTSTNSSFFSGSVNLQVLANSGIAFRMFNTENNLSTFSLNIIFIKD